MLRSLALLSLAVSLAGGCGARQAAAPARTGRDDPHRLLDAEECGQFYDFMARKGWLAEPGESRDAVVAGCLEMHATEAFKDCILGSTTREDADRCQ